MQKVDKLVTLWAVQQPKRIQKIIEVTYRLWMKLDMLPNSITMGAAMYDYLVKKGYEPTKEQKTRAYRCAQMHKRTKRGQINLAKTECLTFIFRGLSEREIEPEHIFTG